jgi:hypothetical protein
MESRKSLLYDVPIGDSTPPGVVSPRHAKKVRQVHLYSRTPGRTVWAQSRQTNRPSLYAISGLDSIPTRQWGQRITRVVSVRFAIGC